MWEGMKMHAGAEHHLLHWSLQEPPPPKGEAPTDTAESRNQTSTVRQDNRGRTNAGRPRA